MKRRYPWKLFLMGFAMNFIIYFWKLFVPGVILMIIGIFSPQCFAVGIVLIVIDLVASIVEQVKIRNTILSDSDNPDFQAFQDALSKEGDCVENIKGFVEARIESAKDNSDFTNDDE